MLRDCNDNAGTNTSSNLKLGMVAGLGVVDSEGVDMADKEETDSDFEIDLEDCSMESNDSNLSTGYKSEDRFKLFLK